MFHILSNIWTIYKWAQWKPNAIKTKEEL